MDFKAKAVFSNTKTEVLLQLARNTTYQPEKKVVKKNVVDAICEEVEDSGIKQLANLLSKVQLQEVCSDIVPQKNESEEEIHYSKTVLKKRLAEDLKGKDVKEFVEEHEISVETLRAMISATGVIVDNKAKKDDLVKQLSYLIQLMGFETFLSRYDLSLLKSVLSDNKLSCSTSSKTNIIKSLVNGVDAEAEPVKNKSDEKPKISRKKKPLEHGTTYHDIFQWYNVSELKDYCRDNGLIINGKKKEVIKRILAHLDENKENKPKQSPSTKKADKPKEKVEEKEKETEKEAEEEKEEEKETEAEKSPKTKVTKPKKVVAEKEKVVEKVVEKEAEVEEKEDEEEEEEEEGELETLKGKVFAITGTLSMKRDAAIKIIEKNGGKYVTSITKAVTHLICEADNTTEKVRKAKENGVKIITEDILAKYDN